MQSELERQTVSRDQCPTRDLDWIYASGSSVVAVEAQCSTRDQATEDLTC